MVFTYFAFNGLSQAFLWCQSLFSRVGWMLIPLVCLMVGATLLFKLVGSFK